MTDIETLLARLDRIEASLRTIDDHIAAAVFEMRESFKDIEDHIELTQR